MFTQILGDVACVASLGRCIDGFLVRISRAIYECVTGQNLSLNNIVILFIQISLVAHKRSSAFTYMLLCLFLTVAGKVLYN
jgi:hypothetical protein